MIRCFIEENLEDWDELLAPLTYAYNTAIHATTKCSPFEIVYEWKPRLPIDLIFPAEIEFKAELEPEDFVRELQDAMKRVFEYVALAHEGSFQRQKFLHDRKIRGNKFNVLDRVYLKNDKPRIGVSKKFKFRYHNRGNGISERRRGNST